MVGTDLGACGSERLEVSPNQDIVLIPTYDRPEMLWLCLEHISRCPEAASLAIRIHVDGHADKITPILDIRWVVEKFPQLHIDVFVRQPHHYAGNSYNLMMAYQDAYLTGARYVFLVEDDLMVAPHFFRWHRWVQKGQPTCSIGITDPGHGAYASQGVCWERTHLRQVLPHACPEYFGAMRAYCHQHFPSSKFDVEQDGLIARVIRGQITVWADPPVCQHVGWYGYHRIKSKKPEGSLQARYSTVQRVLSNEALLKEWARDFHDISSLKSLQSISNMAHY